MVKHWIGVVHLGMTRSMATHGFVSFSHGKQSAIEKVNLGDRVIFYAPRTGMNGDPVQAFVGIATVTGNEPEERDFPETEYRGWVRDADFGPVNEVPVRPMLEDLSFVKKPGHWGMAFRRSLFEIPEQDFTLIASAMNSKG